MQTLYLEWQDMGSLFMAKDPVDIEKRWIIYKTDGLYRFRAVWIKNLTETLVGEEDIQEKAMWRCLQRSIEHLTNASFNEGSLLCSASIAFLSQLTKLYGISNSNPLDNSLQL